MITEYSGRITSINANPPKNPRHYCVGYRDDDGADRMFTIEIANALRSYFAPSSVGNSIMVTVSPTDEVAIVDINGYMAYPRL